jgi:glycosyltransferase involved in cell wall biosynthesis
MPVNVKKRKVAIVYHYFSHYRKPILLELHNVLGDEFEFILISDKKANIPSIKTIEPSFFENCDPGDGFTWRFVRNVWRGKWLWQQGLLKEVLRSNCDSYIFLGQANFLSTWVSAISMRLMGRKIYFWSHGIYGNESLLKLQIRLSFYRLAHGLLLYGNYSRNFLLKHGFSAERTYVIFNSLDYHMQKALRNSRSHGNLSELRKNFYGKMKNLPIAIFVGRLTAVKRLDLLLRAVAKFNENGPTVNCLLIGDGPKTNDLKKLASKLGINETVCFYGACHDEVVLSGLIAISNVCVSPGNVGLTAIHSLGYGTPVVTHDDFTSQMPEFESIIPGITGGFYTKDSLDSLIEQMRIWLFVDRIERERTRCKCYKIIDDYYNPIVQTKIIRQALNDVPATKNDFGPQENICKDSMLHRSGRIL